MVKTWQIPQKNLIDNITLNELPRIITHRYVGNKFRIAAEIDIIQKQAIGRLHRFKYSFVFSLHVKIFIKRKRRKLQIGKPARAALSRTFRKNRGCRAGRYELDIWIGVGKCFKRNLPILLILNFVKENKHLLRFEIDAGYTACRINKFFKTTTIINRHINRQKNHMPRRNLLGKQSSNGMLK